MSIHRLRRVDTLPAVGRDVEAWCTACRLRLEHVITAMNGTDVVQVRCKTCGSVHRYKSGRAGEAAAAAKAAAEVTLGDAPRAAAPASKGAASAAKAAAVKAASAAAVKVSSERQRYERTLATRDQAAAVTYSPQLRPAAGMLLAHASFGLGIVEQVIPGKASVLFADGVKLLVVGR